MTDLVAKPKNFGKAKQLNEEKPFDGSDPKYFGAGDMGQEIRHSMIDFISKHDNSYGFDLNKLSDKELSDMYTKINDGLTETAEPTNISTSGSISNGGQGEVIIKKIDADPVTVKKYTSTGTDVIITKEGKIDISESALRKLIIKENTLIITKGEILESLQKKLK